MKHHIAKSSIAVVAPFIFTLLISCISVTASAQEEKNAGLKIGILDVKKVVNEHPISVKWGEEFKDLKAKREEQVKEKFMVQFNVTDESELTDEQKLQAQAFMVQQNQDFQNEMLMEETKRLQKVEEDIFKFGEEIAKEKGLDFILDQSMVIYGNTVDVTEDMMKLVNEKGSSYK